MLEKLFNWIKLSMPVSRRELKKADCETKRLWAYVAGYGKRVHIIEEDIVAVRNVISNIFREYSRIDVRIDRLSEVVELMSGKLETLDKRLTDLTTAPMSAKPKVITNVDIADIDKLLQRDLIAMDSFKQEIISESKPKIEFIAKDTDKCTCDLEDHKVGKCVFLAKEEIESVAKILSMELNKFIFDSHYYISVFGLDKYNLMVQEKQTLINKFK